MNYGWCAFLLILITICHHGESTNITFDDLPEGNYTTPDEIVTIGGLGALFGMSVNFVNIVFPQFSVLEDKIVGLVKGTESFGLETISDIVTLEIGYVVCVAFGILFIILVVVGGLIMLCCRCCDNCGGEMTQSLTRAHSKWRHCLTGTLLLLVVFMFAPCILIFLTNEYLSSVLTLTPGLLNAELDNVAAYVELVPVQLNHTVDEFDKLDAAIRYDVANINVSMGIPVRDAFINLSQPALQQFEYIGTLAGDTRQQVDTVSTSLTNIQSGLTGLSDQLAYTRAGMKAELNTSTCRAIPACQDIVNGLDALTIGGDFSSLDTTELDAVSAELASNNVTARVEEVENMLNDIPQKVAEASAGTAKTVTDLLDVAKTSLTEMEDVIPTSEITSITSQMEDLKGSVTKNVDYVQQYDVYRYAAGAVLGAVMLLICVFYLAGLVLGHTSYNEQASHRSAASNCGGIFIMSAVGFTFLFSWLLMIVVMIFFSVGGHGERFACQSLEPPYVGLEFVDRVVGPVNVIGRNLSVHELVMSCEADNSVYAALQLNSTIDLPAVINNITRDLDTYRGNLTEITVDLSSVDVYNDDVNSSLTSLTTTGIEDVDFDAFINATTHGLTQIDLTSYAEDLNTTADSIPDASLQGVLRSYSYNITQIQRLHVTPLQPEVDALNSGITGLNNTASIINQTVDTTRTLLMELDMLIETNATEIVAEQIVIFANGIINNVVLYTEWLLLQVEQNFGKCRVLFNTYSQLVAIVCSYFMDILGGFWFSLGWCVAFLIPSAIVGMKLAKFYRRMSYYDDGKDWNLEMEPYQQGNKV